MGAEDEEGRKKSKEGGSYFVFHLNSNRTHHLHTQKKAKVTDNAEDAVTLKITL